MSAYKGLARAPHPFQPGRMGSGEKSLCPCGHDHRHPIHAPSKK